MTPPNEESEKLKEDPGEDGAVPVLTTVPHQQEEPADKVCELYKDYYLTYTLQIARENLSCGPI